MNPPTPQPSDGSKVVVPQHPETLTKPSPLSTPPPPTSPTEPKEKVFGDDSEQKQNGFVSALKFIFSWILIPLTIVLLFQAFIFQAFYVQGQSMEPTFQDGDYLVISKVGITSQKLRKIVNKNAVLNYKRGTVLVFRPPIALSTFYIKRLIGLPGERVVIKDGTITIYNKENPQGFVLKEKYTDQAATTLGDIDITVDQDKVFVLGDNREPNGSYDSRQWGQLPQNDITGRVLIRLLPINRFRIVSPPAYSGLIKYTLRYLL